MGFLRQYDPIIELPEGESYLQLEGDLWCDAPLWGWPLSQLTVDELMMLGACIQFLDIYSESDAIINAKMFKFVTPCYSENNFIVKKLWHHKVIRFNQKDRDFLDLPAHARKYTGKIKLEIMVEGLGVNKTADVRLIVTELKSRQGTLGYILPMLHRLSVNYYSCSFRYLMEQRLGSGQLDLVDFNLFPSTLEYVVRVGYSSSIMRCLAFRAIALMVDDGVSGHITSGKQELIDHVYNDYLIKVVHGFDVDNLECEIYPRLAHAPIFSMEQMISSVTGYSIANLYDRIYRLD